MHASEREGRLRTLTRLTTLWSAPSYGLAYTPPDGKPGDRAKRRERLGKLTGEHRRRHCASFDVCRDADATELPLSRGFLPTPLKSGIVGGLSAISSVVK